jgi:hypothetical protein
MKSKFKIILLVSAFLVSIFVGKVSVAVESPLNSYLKTARQDLLAIAKQQRNLPNLQLINSNSLSFSQVQDKDTSPCKGKDCLNFVKSSNSPLQNMEIAQNTNQSSVDNFPLGWYDSVDNLNTPAKIAKEGINIVIPYTGERSTQEVKAYLDRAKTAGLKVIVEIPRKAVRVGKTEEVIQFVQQFKGHPATFGWYLYDEPDYVQLSPNILGRLYQSIKAEDREHPVAIAFTKLERVEPYLKALDIVMFSKYPSNYNEAEFSGLQGGIFAKIAKNAALVAQNKSQFWFILQGYGEDKYGRQGQKNKRLPTAAEQKYMLYSTVLAKADGLFFWTHYRSRQEWINSVLTPLIKEFKTYLPTIKTQALNDKLAFNNDQIQGNLYRNPTTNNLLLIAINHGNSNVETEFKISEDSRATSATVLTEKRSVDFLQGRLKDSFKPYAVHIYQIARS